MRRPAVRLLLTLAISACVVGVVPATTEAGIIPWAYDAVFGPVGSLQAQTSGYYGGAYSANYGGAYSANYGGAYSANYGGAYSANYGGAYGANYGGCSTGCSTPCSTGYCGPAPRLFGGLRAWRMRSVGYGGYGMGGCGTCSTGCGYSSCGTSYGGFGGCNTCGGSGCSSCGGGGCGVQGFGGGCPGGQCGVNYPPPLTQNNTGVNAAAPVTPAPPPVTTDKSGPVQNDVPAVPMGRSGTSDGYPGPMVPGAGEGFRPRGAGVPTPTGGDPTAEQFVPPKINTPAKAPGTDASPNDASPPAPPSEPQNGTGTGTGTEPATPAIAPKPKPKRNFGDDEDEKKGTSVGPRLELNEKVTWRREVIHSRQAPTAVRVSATMSRSALFPKMAWRTTADAELAKK